MNKEQKAVLFTNWTNEDFEWAYGGVLYAFKAGQSIYLQDYLAEHFTKHLVDRELNKDKLPTNSHLRAEYEAKCYGEVIKAESPEKLESVLMNEPKQEEPKQETPINEPNQELTATSPVKRFCDSCDSKGVRHLKVCPNYKPTK